MARKLAGKLWGRGESMIASIGLAASAVLVAVLGAGAWWTLHTHREALQEARRSEVKAAAESLQSALETLIAANDMSPVRRALAESVFARNLDSATIVLPDGSVLASGNPRSPMALPPADWPVGQLPFRTGETESGTAHETVELNIPGRGRAMLELRANARFPMWTASEVQLGVGVISAAGMLGLLAATRYTRRRLRALAAIRSSLQAANAGEHDGGALRVSADYGAEAGAWNHFLAEREQQREELLLARAAVRKEQEGPAHELVSACDSFWHGLLLVDGTMRVRYANGAGAVLLGARGTVLAGEDFTALARDRRVIDAVRAVLSGKARHRVSVEIERTDVPGGGVLRFGTRPASASAPTLAIVVVEDITQQRAADQSRNSFVAQATHELRTPLTNMRLYLDSLLEDGDADPAARARAINVISGESRRLERIVADMLSMSEIEAGSMTVRRDDVRLDALFQELEHDYRAAANDKNIGLSFVLSPKLPVLHADRDKVTLALHNLIGNALKYTPSGGTVVVNVAADAARLSVDVSDTGIGIREEERDLIFDKFYRARDKRIEGITGSGLGLTLAREVARLHGGDITVKSQVGKGSTFTLWLPVVDRAVAAAA